MTYIVSGVALNSTHSLRLYVLIGVDNLFWCGVMCFLLCTLCMIYVIIIMLSLVFVTCHPVTSLWQEANRGSGRPGHLTP